MLIVFLVVFGIAAVVVSMIGAVSYLAFASDDFPRLLRSTHGTYGRIGDKLHYTRQNEFVISNLKLRVTKTGRYHFNVECKVPFVPWQRVWQRATLELATSDIEDVTSYFRSWLAKRPTTAVVVGEVVEVVPSENKE